ncbi:hypothetical protein ABQG68_19385, partial [Bacillus pumilus]|uniref:hypothetical protein n=1 Tax=Bacillus pumilus TaxID=1408 RepID=UPI00331533BE
DGEVTNLNGDEKEVCVQTSVQAFWFTPDKLHPIPINDEELQKIGFTKQTLEDGSIKYMKGAFRLVMPSNGDLTKIEMWYREDRRKHPSLEYIHQLQNAYMDMTKVHLTKQPV